MFGIQCLASQGKHFYAIIHESVPAACEHGETIAWMAGRPPPWCHSFAATAKPDRFGEGWGSKIKAWHQVIETIPYTSGKKSNLVTHSAEKEIIPCYCLESQESGVILRLQKHFHGQTHKRVVTKCEILIKTPHGSSRTHI